MVSDAQIFNNGGSPAGGAFVNAGTLSKTGGTGTSAIGVTLTDTGPIQATSGTLGLWGGGTTSGAATLTAGAGADLDFHGGTFAVAAGSSLSGAGTMSFSGATVTVAGSYNVAGQTSVSGGTVDFNSSATAETLAQSGGTLTGAGTLTVNGALSWTGGTMSGSGTTVANGGLTLGGTATSTYYLEYLSARTLNNFGTATLASYYDSHGLYIDSGGTLNNEAGASFTLVSDAQIFNNGGSPAGGTFVNAGTLSKTGGTGTSTIGVALNNAGTIQAASGTLYIQGTFSNYASATHTLTGGSYIVSATLQFPDVNIVTNASAITLSGTASQIVDTSSLDALRHFATNTSDGSLTLLGGRNLTTPGAFSNAGAVTVGAGSTFTATGAYTQSGGSTNLAGGALTSTTSTVSINGGLLGGSGTVNGNVNNSGQVIPGGVGAIGVLDITGTYTQTSSGSTTINLGGTNPGTGYSQLTVGGLATLAGDLDVNLVNGFAPANNDTFQVLNYNSHSGQFANIVLENFPAGITLNANYHASDLTLTASVVPVLTSIAVTPVTPSVALGLTQQFTATGTYSDNSTADLTNEVTWVSARHLGGDHLQHVGLGGTGRDPGARHLEDHRHTG